MPRSKFDKGLIESLQVKCLKCIVEEIANDNSTDSFLRLNRFITNSKISFLLLSIISKKLQESRYNPKFIKYESILNHFNGLNSKISVASFSNIKITFRQLLILSSNPLVHLNLKKCILPSFIDLIIPLSHKCSNTLKILIIDDCKFEREMDDSSDNDQTCIGICTCIGMLKFENLVTLSLSHINLCGDCINIFTKHSEGIKHLSLKNCEIKFTDSLLLGYPSTVSLDLHNAQFNSLPNLKTLISLIIPLENLIWLDLGSFENEILLERFQNLLQILNSHPNSFPKLKVLIFNGQKITNIDHLTHFITDHRNLKVLGICQATFRHKKKFFEFINSNHKKLTVAGDIESNHIYNAVKMFHKDNPNVLNNALNSMHQIASFMHMPDDLNYANLFRTLVNMLKESPFQSQLKTTLLKNILFMLKNLLTNNHDTAIIFNIQVNGFISQKELLELCNLILSLFDDDSHDDIFLIHIINILTIKFEAKYDYTAIVLKCFQLLSSQRCSQELERPVLVVCSNNIFSADLSLIPDLDLQIFATNIMSRFEHEMIKEFGSELNSERSITRNTNPALLFSKFLMILWGLSDKNMLVASHIANLSLLNFVELLLNAEDYSECQTQLFGLIWSISEVKKIYQKILQTSIPVKLFESISSRDDELLLFSRLALSRLLLDGKYYWVSEEIPFKSALEIFSKCIKISRYIPHNLIAFSTLEPFNELIKSEHYALQLFGFFMLKYLLEGKPTFYTPLIIQSEIFDKINVVLMSVSDKYIVEICKGIRMLLNRPSFSF